MHKPPTKKGLWPILYPVIGTISSSIFLATIGVIGLLMSLTLLSFTLSHLLQNEPITLLGTQMDLFNTVLLLAVVTIIAFLTRLSSFMVSHLGAFRLEQILRTELSSHLAKVPLGYIINIGSGTLKKVIQNDVRGLHTFVADSIPMIAKSVLAPVLTLVILLWVDYRFALACLSVLFIGTIIMSFSMRDAKTARENYDISQAQINKAVIEFAQAMPVVRTFDDGSSSFKKYNDSLQFFKQSLNRWMEKSSFSAKLGIVVLSPLPTLIVVLLTGLYLIDTSSVELSAFILALFLSTGMADALLPIMWLQNFIKKSQASAIRIQEILEVEPLVETSDPISPKDASIRFDNVSFSYECSDRKALDAINFVVPKKSVTALVGPSGAGKSTVAKLLPRFWDVTQGSISIGGADIRQMSSEQLMDTVSFVFQDTFLFHDTIYNNIKMANPNASDEAIINAAKAAQIHDFIEGLPEGYQTQVGERGSNLSGGQKQRITIARAILRNAPVIVLDEATAFADPENEEQIIKALAHMMKDKTVIIIAHRLSTIKDADQIVVIDKGAIQESGTHQQLIENRKIYHKLWSQYEQANEWNLQLQEQQP